MSESFFAMICITIVAVTLLLIFCFEPLLSVKVKMFKAFTSGRRKKPQEKASMYLSDIKFKALLKKFTFLDDYVYEHGAHGEKKHLCFKDNILLTVCWCALSDSVFEVLLNKKPIERTLSSKQRKSLLAHVLSEGLKCEVRVQKATIKDILNIHTGETYCNTCQHFKKETLLCMCKAEHLLYSDLSTHCDRHEPIKKEQTDG